MLDQFNSYVCEVDFGACLLIFFNEFGGAFQIEDRCISVLNWGSITPKVKMNVSSDTLLCLWNPLDESLDVGKDAYNFSMVQPFFKWAHGELYQGRSLQSLLQLPLHGAAVF